jgi:hypothetical protein
MPTWFLGFLAPIAGLKLPTLAYLSDALSTKPRLKQTIEIWWIGNYFEANSNVHLDPWRTDKKEKKIFLIYKEFQMGSVSKSYMRKGFLIYEEMRKYLVIYEEAVSQ